MLGFVSVLSQKACMCARALDSEDDVQNYVEPADLAPCAPTSYAAGVHALRKFAAFVQAVPFCEFSTMRR